MSASLQTQTQRRPGSGHARLDTRGMHGPCASVPSLAAAMVPAGITLDDLDLVVPHQANSRILDAVHTRLKLPENRVWSGLRFTGNTSSSPIPRARDTVLRQERGGHRIGLCAFGAGYTFGTAVPESGG